MNILLLHHRFPFPIRSGMDKATYGLIRALTLEHNITLLVPLDQRITQQKDIDQLKELDVEAISVTVKSRILAMKRTNPWYWIRFLCILFRIPSLVVENYYFSVARMLGKLDKAHNYDLIQASSLASAAYLRSVDSARTMILAHEAHSELTRTYLQFTANRISRFLGWLNYQAFLHYEPRVYRRCRWLAALSKIDLDRIKELSGALPFARHLPVAIESTESAANIVSFDVQHQELNSMVFVGGLGPVFNQDAVLYFYREIFPFIKAKIPYVKFYIVGENPPKEIQELAKEDNIVITGRVKDVTPYIEKAAVYVAPARLGGGVKTKLIEALSLGKAIVTTSLSIAGLWDLGEEVFCIQDDPENFAEQTVLLLRNDQLRQSIGRRALELFNKSYAFDAVAPKTLAVYKEIENSI